MAGRKSDFEYAMTQAMQLDPLQKRRMIMVLTELLMEMSDDAFELYSKVHEALDQPEMILAIKK